MIRLMLAIQIAAWVVTHPLNALTWLIFGEPYSTVWPRARANRGAGSALLALLIVLLVSSVSFGQTDAIALPKPPAPPTNSTAITPTQAGDIIIGAVLDGAKDWVVALDGMWARDAKDQFGALLLIGYRPNNSQYLIIGAHVEYLNKLPTYGGGQLTLQLPLDPLASFTNSLPNWITAIQMTPYGYVGSGTSFGMGKAVTIVGEAAVGDSFVFWRSRNKRAFIGANIGTFKRTDLAGIGFIGGLDGGINF